MEKLAIVLRYAQLCAHNAHNLSMGESFFADHAFLGELYPIYEEAYDSIIERLIGLGREVDLVFIQKEAASYLQAKDNYFEELLNVEEVIQGHIDKLVKGPALSEGTKQLLGGLADESEQRVYKIKQRLKED